MQKTGPQKFLEAFGFFMMLVLVLVGAALIWLGGREYSLSSQFPRPQAIAFDEIVRKKPGDGWFRITGAALDLRNVAWEEETGTDAITRAFIPLRSISDPQDRKIHILVDTKRPDIIAIVRQMGASNKNQGRSSPFPTGFPGDMPGENNWWWIPQPVDGIVSYSGQAGVVASRLKSGNIALQNALEPGYIYLNEGREPSKGAAAGFILMGLILIGVIVMAVVKIVRQSQSIRVG